MFKTLGKSLIATVAITLLGGLAAVPAMAVKPVAITEAATSVTATRATLNATIEASGEQTRAAINYWPEGGLKWEKSTPVVIVSGTKKLSTTVSLEPGTTYHFEAVAWDFATGKTSAGKELSLTTETLHPARYEADAYPAAIAGSQNVKREFEAANGSGWIECGTASLNAGSKSEATQSLSLATTYSGCQVDNSGGAWTAEMKMNSCAFSLALNNPGPPYTGGYGVSCSKEGDAIEAKIYEGSVGSKLICTVTIPAQSTTGSIGAANQGEGSARKVLATGTATGVHYTASGGGICTFLGFAAGTHETGIFPVAATLEATSEGKATGFHINGGTAPVGMFLTGSASEEASKQPHFAAQAYPATMTGSENVQDEFLSANGGIECSTASLNAGSKSEATQSLSLATTYSGCQAGGNSSWPTEVKMNSCAFSLGLNNVGPPYAGTYAVSCSKEGDAIEAKIYQESFGGTPICTVTIPAQSTAGSISAATQGEWSARKVLATGTATGVHYSVVSGGAICTLLGFPGGSYENGKFPVAATLEATYLG